jgi:hypothetical protein
LRQQNRVPHHVEGLLGWWREGHPQVLQRRGGHHRFQAGKQLPAPFQKGGGGGYFLEVFFPPAEWEAGPATSDFWGGCTGPLTIWGSFRAKSAILHPPFYRLFSRFCFAPRIQPSSSHPLSMMSDPLCDVHLSSMRATHSSTTHIQSSLDQWHSLKR